MKKALIIALLLIASPVFAQTAPASPVPVYNGQAVTFSCSGLGSDGDGHFYEVFLNDADNNHLASGGTDCAGINGNYVSNWASSHEEYGTYRVGVADTNSPDFFGASGLNHLVPPGSGINGFVFVQTFEVINQEPPSPPDSGLFDSSIIMASVVSSVQQTGNLLWPLFVFMGILIAFYIATKVGDFVRESIGRRRNGYYHQKSAGSSDLVYDKDQKLGKAEYELQERGMTEL